MNVSPLLQIIKAVVRIKPCVVPMLSPDARVLVGKTYEYFLSTLTRLIQSVYDGNLGGEFVSILKDLILGQISQAYETAWTDEGNDLPVPEYLRDASQTAVQDQWSFVDDFYKEIVDARVDKTPVEPFLGRADLWANRYNEAYNEAVHLITLENGGKEEWIYDPNKEHCTTCAALNGIVAYASEWDELGVMPQNAPNDLLECGGWKCGCERRPTDKRRSPKAYDTIMNIVSK